jgi:predicted sulfurtransferase/predicted O-methyltransferase YrrM
LGWILFMLPTALALQNSRSFGRVFARHRNFQRFSLMSLSGQSQAESQSKMPSNITSVPIVIGSNQEIVDRQLAVIQAKREARTRSMNERYEKNLRMKRLLHTDVDRSSASEANEAPTLYAVKVMADDDLRRDLRLSGRERRGRVFLERDSDAVRTLRSLKSELHSFFRALRKDTYTLAAGYPQVETSGSDGTLETKEASQQWPIESDEDVARTFQVADDFFAENDSVLKHPSIVIHVLRDPNAPPPPPPAAWLQNMTNPADSPTMTMLSFYSFPPTGVADPDAFAEHLRKAWKLFEALGRIYVANEGVNAQMSIPTAVLENFIECCRSIPELGSYMENGINIDPVVLTRVEFATAGVPGSDGEPGPPFKNLHVRVRRQVVADGLDKALNWQSAGYDMPPLEWHQKLKEAKEARSGESESNPKEVPLILDCRNTYETDVGRFEGAEPLETENFRDSWTVLEERLSEVPKDAPIMTYCTGGIRCVKVGAYLTQELGFTNVSRLAGGIIAYDRTLNEKAADEEPMFKGSNFVFDGRLGRAITEDAMGVCITCSFETSMVSNCRNGNCHKRMIQCESCQTSFHGTCSDACRMRIVNGAMTPRRGSLSSSSSETTESTEPVKYTTIDEYSSGHSSPPPSIYPEIEFNTRALFPSGSHMVSGSTQGRLLAQLASMTREGRVLELGTFTGYATACLLEGAANAGRVIGSTDGSREGGPFVMTMERDSRAFDVAVSHMKIVAEHGMGEGAAEAVCALRASNVESVPVVEDGVVSVSYDGVASCELVRVTDALAIVEEMAAGQGDLRPAPFDMVFVDADKTRLLDYAEACLSSDLVLKKGGLIVVDNVLWKGLVLEANNGEFSSMAENENTEETELRKNRRARKLATKMHRFNSAIVLDDRVEVLVLPLRDGLSVIRKK